MVYCSLDHASRRVHFVESDLHNSSVLRLESPSGSNAMVDESRDGRFSRRSSKTPRPISGRPYPNLVSLDARMAAALKRMIQNSNFTTWSTWRSKKGPKKKTDSFVADRSNM